MALHVQDQTVGVSVRRGGLVRSATLLAQRVLTDQTAPRHVFVNATRRAIALMALATVLWDGKASTATHHAGLMSGGPDVL